MNPAIHMALHKALESLDEAARDKIDSMNLSEVSDLIPNCSIAAAVAGVGAGWLPGVGSAVASAAWVGTIWTMYLKINKKLGIATTENILKVIASAFLTNILSAGGGLLIALAGGSLLSLIPFVGQAGAIAMDGMIGYVTTYVSGILYIKLLTSIVKRTGSIDFSSLSAEDLKSMAKNVANDSEIRDMVKSAKEAFKEDKKDGKISK